MHLGKQMLVLTGGSQPILLLDHWSQAKTSSLEEKAPSVFGFTRLMSQLLWEPLTSAPTPLFTGCSQGCARRQ